jgi:glutamate carboxypeptidase
MSCLRRILVSVGYSVSPKYRKLPASVLDFSVHCVDSITERSFPTVSPMRFKELFLITTRFAAMRFVEMRFAERRFKAVRFVIGLPSLKPLVLLSLIVGGFPLASQAQLTDTEEAMVATIDSRYSLALNLLERTVNINSGSMNFAGVKRVGEVFMEEFDGLGFETKWIDGTEFNRSGHVYARYGSSGPHILMIGHLDTVFEPDSPFQKFAKFSDTEAKGPGTIDMKGGNIIMLEALHALKEAGLLDEMIITVVLTGDEESSGRPFSLSRAVLTQAADEADIALGFEDGDGNPATAVVARRGYTGWHLQVTGTPAHSSQIFRDDLGYGAVFEAARILNSFREQLSEEDYLTFNPGLILGGTTTEYDEEQARGSAFGKSNVIAEHALASGDIRTISLEQLSRTKERMKAIVEDHLPGTESKISFEDGYPPLSPTDGNRRLLALLDKTSRDLGDGPVEAVDPRLAGAADISFTAGRVEMALDGLGLMGDYGHTVNETADLTTLSSQAKRVAILMARLLNDDGTR